VIVRFVDSVEITIHNIYFHNCGPRFIILATRPAPKTPKPLDEKVKTFMLILH